MKKLGVSIPSLFQHQDHDKRKKAMAKVAREVLRIPPRNSKAEDSTFRRFLGAPVGVITDIRNRIEANLDPHAPQPKHLLWSLVSIKVYSTEEVHCCIVGWPDPKTYRKWMWYFREKIAGLAEEVILFDNRFDGADGSSSCLISVDGTDCPINEPWPFDKKW
jgi:hypothetical protein